jgi:hypothetical protein
MPRVLPVPESEHGKLDTAGAAVAAVAVEATPKPTADTARAAAVVRRNTRRAITEVSDREGDWSAASSHRTCRENRALNHLAVATTAA